MASAVGRLVYNVMTAICLALGLIIVGVLALVFAGGFVLVFVIALAAGPWWAVLCGGCYALMGFMFWDLVWGPSSW